MRISIHAPREGCDATPRPRAVQAHSFQSTHPVRGATPQRLCLPALLSFQSTHPVRGATRTQTQKDPVNQISIHAPREGCDKSSNSASSTAHKFQSTHPVRGATRPMVRSCKALNISIHAPREGCDHAVGRQRYIKISDFNPRTP